MLFHLTTPAMAALSGPFEFLFHTWSFTFLGKDIFAHDFFETFMRNFRIGFALVAAGLLIIEWRAKRLGEKLPDKITKRILWAFGIVGFLCYFDFFNPNVRYPDYYHRHEFYPRRSRTVAASRSKSATCVICA
jgi:hypothetical protein